MADAQTTFASVDDYVADRREKREAAPAPKPKAEKPAPAPAVEPEEEIADEAAPEKAAPVETETDPAPQAGDDTGQEPEEANLEGDEQEQAKEPETAIPAPDFWDAEGKDAFAKLPREAQEQVRAYEQQRTQAVARKLNEAAQVSKAAQARSEQLEQARAEMSRFVSEATNELKQYDQIDWAEQIADATTDEELRNVYWHKENAEKLRKQRVEAVKAEDAALTRELQEHHQITRQRLKQIAKHEQVDLDPDTETGRTRITQISKFLTAVGIDDNTQAWMPAEAMALAHDAMMYRMQKQKAQSSTQIKPVTQKPAAGATVKPSSPGTAGSSSQQRIQQLSAPNKVLSQDEFTELRKLKRKSKR
jgi:hypothetical protein